MEARARSRGQPSECATCLPCICLDLTREEQFPTWLVSCPCQDGPIVNYARMSRVRRRFFVEQFLGDRAFIEGDAAHHLGRVLRAERGQLYELSDGHRVCLARIEDVKRDRLEFSLIEDVPSH